MQLHSVWHAYKNIVVVVPEARAAI
eukprot:COSAG02_NODE_24911_length_674_cov_0.991304_2_plen_24_part_01